MRISYYTGSHTPQRQTVRYLIPHEVRQRLTTRDLIPRSIRLFGMLLPPEVRLRLTTRHLLRRSVRLCGMCNPAKWDSVLLHGSSYPAASHCAVCAIPRSETTSYYTWSPTTQRQTVRYVKPREERQRRVLLHGISYPAALDCAVCYPVKWESVSLHGISYPTASDCAVCDTLRGETSVWGPGFRVVRLCGSWCIAECVNPCKVSQ